ncbi:MAG: hypothetical protein MUC57_13450 [Desulfobacterales bacterium]|nr:hypothetical protein [Desulfobacterales bacterium]
MASIQRYRASIPITPRERRVRDVYDRVDAATERELGRLRGEEGVVSNCKRGCCSCCGQHIQMNPAEAHALTQYIKRMFSMPQIRSLKRRTQQWLALDGIQRKGLSPVDRAGLSDNEPCCPLLVDCACSVYPVRPIICRTHFVSSDPSACRRAYREPSSEPAPIALMSILHVTQPLAKPLRADIEAAGIDYSRSIMLLPHWLAMEMSWEFPE